MPIKKIVVIGPESTGKSTLCESLAAHFQTAWCPEYAREYLLTHGKKYDYEDLLTIGRGQISLEETHIDRLTRTWSEKSDPLLFIDTDSYVMKVWCEFVFGKCHQWILDQIVSRSYDYYFLCNTDLPWIADELREYPDLESRARLFRIYKDIMINQQVPWLEISGDYENRFRQAVRAVELFLAK